MVYKSKMREMPEHLKEKENKVLELARWYGLDPFETKFVMVDHNILHKVASTSGFPVRYPSWKWGMEEFELQQKYKHGLMNIYEMVVNTDASIAYMFDTNSDIDHITVFAHVFGHTDFFKHNFCFSKTNRNMLNRMANNANRVRAMMGRHGMEEVESFLNRCFSIERLIDPMSEFVSRDFSQSQDLEAITEEKIFAPKLKRGYMNKFVDCERIVKEQKEELERKKRQLKTKEKEGLFIPDEGIRDIVGFLQEHGKLENWQRDILEIIREDSYYFVPQMRTKIMNEGWAVFWQKKIMVEQRIAGDDGILDYANHTAGTLASPGFNPYKLGLQLWEHIENMFNRGKDSIEYEKCKDRLDKKEWGSDIAKEIERMSASEQRHTRGREMMFLIRKIYSDESFVRDFFTPDFAIKYNYYNWGVDEEKKNYVLEDRDHDTIKKRILQMLTNWDKPVLRIIDANHDNVGGLYIRHEYRGLSLNNENDWKESTLRNIYHMWGRPVFLESSRTDLRRGQGYLVKFDGKNFSSEEITIPVYRDMED